MNELVAIRDGEVRTTSLDVAAAFEKAHKNILRDIDKLIELAPELTGRNFEPSQIRSPGTRGRVTRAYEISRDGFSLLAMGFTGPEGAPVEAEVHRGLPQAGGGAAALAGGE
jgi:Rha family phage regulatory protein